MAEQLGLQQEPLQLAKLFADQVNLDFRFEDFIFPNKAWNVPKLQMLFRYHLKITNVQSILIPNLQDSNLVPYSSWQLYSPISHSVGL